MKRTFAVVAVAALTAMVFSCTPKPDPEPDVQDDYYYVNQFAYNEMSAYYLWVEEIAEGMASWYTNADPVRKVQEIRYKDSYGNDIDKWTQMLESYEESSSSVAGVSKTYGFDFALYYADSGHKSICAVVTLVYPGSPAAEAGMMRGDVIAKVNGKTMTEQTYYDIVVDELLGGDSCSLSLNTGKQYDLKSVQMYEEPVLCSKVFDCGSKKIGYLMYNSFTMDSYEPLIAAFSSFKAAGVTELILDLRYNGGGYLTAAETLASLIAPEKEVLAGSLFEQEIYNSQLSEAMKKSDEDFNKTFFHTDFKFTNAGKTYDYSTLGANPGIRKLYALVGSGTASASELLLVGLKPYMDVELLGTQTHGKYCAGIMFSGKDFYETVGSQLEDGEYEKAMEKIGDWGIYVMISRYADKNGNTPCMPDGFVPDFGVEDNPLDGCQLGDPEETMLAFALSRAGYMPASKAPSARRPAKENLQPCELQVEDSLPGLVVDPKGFPASAARRIH